MNNYYLLKITCKNPKQFVGYLYKRHVDIWNIKYVEDGLVIKVTYRGYLDILKIKTSYKIEIIDIKGFRKVKWIFLNNKMFIIFFITSLFLITLISNVIFKIEYIDVSEKLRPIIEKELKVNNLRCFTLKKNYYELNEIKHNIKKNNQEIEWIEIHTEGVKLIVRAIERKDRAEISAGESSNIVANKDGFLIDIKALSGEIVKDPGDYVKKGDVIISGIIKNKEDIVNLVESNGEIYAEVWYIVVVEKSLQESQEVFNEKTSTRYAFYIFGKKINILKPKGKAVTEKKLINSKSFAILKEYRQEVDTKIIKYTPNEMMNILEKMAEDQIKSNLKEEEFIIQKKTLKKSVENGKMKIEVFFKVKEEIGIGQKIDMVE